MRSARICKVPTVPWKFHCPEKNTLEPFSHNIRVKDFERISAIRTGKRKA